MAKFQVGDDVKFKVGVITAGRRSRAAFGLAAFEGDFDYAKDDDQEDNHGCHSTMACFWLIAYQGIPSGGYIEAGMIPQVRWIGSVSVQQRLPASVQRPLAPVSAR